LNGVVCATVAEEFGKMSKEGVKNFFTVSTPKFLGILFGAIIPRVLEAGFWLGLSGMIGDALLGLFGYEAPSSVGAELMILSDSIYKTQLIDAYGAGSLALSPYEPFAIRESSILGMGAVGVLSWLLSDLPLNSFIRLKLRGHEQQKFFVKVDNKIDEYLIEGFSRRALYARNTARAILLLMVATLILALWVFIAAPGVEGTRNLLVRQSAREISNASSQIQSQMYALSRAADDAKAVLAEFQTSTPDRRFELAPKLLRDLSQVTLKYARLPVDVGSQITTASEEIKASAQKIVEAVSKNPEPLNSQSTLTRLGSVAILFVALQVLNGLYRKASELSQRYAATADGLLMALHRQATSLDDDRVFQVIGKVAPPSEVAVGITTPLDAAGNLAEKLTPLTDKIGEWTEKLTELVKSLKPG
jgi:hypothetical protein